MAHQAVHPSMSEGLKYFVNSDFDNCMSELTRVLDQEPDNRVALSSRGAAYFKLDRLSDAIADFDQALAQDEENARAFHLRGAGLGEKRGSEGGTEGL